MMQSSDSEWSPQGFSPGDRKPVPIKPKLLRRSLEPMLLLNILGRVQGAHQSRATLGASAYNTRDFADKLAYLCDVKKGGETVTAVALQATPQGMVVHLVANTQMKEDVHHFCGWTLYQLSNVRSDTRHNVASSILKKVIPLAKKRLDTYWLKAQRYIQECREVLENHHNNAVETSNVLQWFDELEKLATETPKLVRECYRSRRSHNIRYIKSCSANGQPQSSSFEQLFHFLGRLGAHCLAVTTVVKTALRNPQMFVGVDFVVHASSKRITIPFPPKNMTMESMLGRMCEKGKAAPYLAKLSNSDQRLGLNMNMRLLDMKDVKTTVHAELLLLEVFQKENYDFYDSDKYIGCSKPACYSCYKYFHAQAPEIQTPATHNKLYTNWRPPDIFDEDDEVSIKRRNDTLNRMNKLTREDVKARIDKGCQALNPHFDSTTGISETYGSSRTHGSVIELEEPLAAATLRD